MIYQLKYYPLWVVILVSFFSLHSLSYIPSSKMIFERVVENSVKLPLYIELDLNISQGDQTVFLKEQWLIESENSIRILVKGDKEFKDQISFQVTDKDNQGNTYLSGTNKTKIRPLMEKVLIFKKTEQIKQFLVQQGILKEEEINSVNFKKIPGNSGFQYQPELFIRLGRVDGGISYIFGPKPRNENPVPGLWVEQDQFFVRKIRNIQGDEIQFDKITTFSRNTRWTKVLEYFWRGNKGNGHARAQVTNVKIPDTNQRAFFTKFLDKKSPYFEQSSQRPLIEDFYQRFR